MALVLPHAVYLATIAEYAASNWGVAFQSVEAFNEPVSAWWNGETGTQEGCHFDVSTQATVIGDLRTELNNRGLSSTLVAASDENTYDLAISTLQWYSTWKNLLSGKLNPMSTLLGKYLPGLDDLVAN